MIMDRDESRTGERRRILRPLLVGAPLVLLVWTAILLGATFLQGAGKPVAVFALGGSHAALAAVAAADGALLEMTSTSVIAISDDPAFVRRLYANGALLVLASAGRNDSCLAIAEEMARAVRGETG